MRHQYFVHVVVVVMSRKNEFMGEGYVSDSSRSLNGMEWTVSIYRRNIKKEKETKKGFVCKIFW